MSDSTVMDKLNVTLGLVVAFFAVPVTLTAATPRPLASQTPVVLLPQIEELEETSALRETSVPAAPAVEKPSGRDSFPPARQFWKRWRNGPESRTTSSAEKSPAVPPEPRREVVTVSDLQLEPIVEIPAPSQRQVPALPVMQAPSPVPSLRTEVPSTTLISPSPDAGDLPCERTCDQQVLESAPQTVAPRSLKLGNGFRFPHLSNLFH